MIYLYTFSKHRATKTRKTVSASMVFPHYLKEAHHPFLSRAGFDLYSSKSLNCLGLNIRHGIFGFVVDYKPHNSLFWELQPEDAQLH